MAPFEGEDSKPTGLSIHKHQRGTTTPNCRQTRSILGAVRYKSHGGLSSFHVHGNARCHQQLTSVSSDGWELCVRTEMSCICVWAHFPLKPLSSEWGIVFLPTCPKDLDKVIEINSWEMIPTSYIRQMIAARKQVSGEGGTGRGLSQESLHLWPCEEKTSRYKRSIKGQMQPFSRQGINQSNQLIIPDKCKCKKKNIESTTSYSVYQQICNRTV